jgi:His-Xaa-Ser system protein HxsD
MEIKISLKEYPVDAVYLAITTLSDRINARILKQDKENIVLEIKSKVNDKEIQENLEEVFTNELIHHTLRYKISENNKDLREKIVTAALYSAQSKSNDKPSSQSFQNEIDEELEKEIEKLIKEAEKESYKKDPKKIKVPWEEKNRKRKGGEK